MVHPFLKWAGGKTRLLRKIDEAIGDGLIEKKTYVEPFIGSGAVFLSLTEKHKFDKIIVNDLNSQLIDVYIDIRDNCERLKTELQKLENDYVETGNKSEYYYVVRNNFNLFLKEKNEDSVIQSARFIFLNKTCYNGMYRVNSKGFFNIPAGRNNNKKLIDYNNIDEVSKKLVNVIIENMDYSNLLNKYSSYIDEECLLYFDPPYSTSGGEKGFTSYNKQVFCWNDQENLESTVMNLKDTGAMIVMSNISSDCVEKLYDKEIYTVHRFTRRCTIGGTIKSRKEYGELIIVADFSKVE